MRRTLLITLAVSLVGAVGGLELAAHACPPMIRPPPPPPGIEEGPRGRLTIRTTPAARVTIDGRSYGTTPVLGRWLGAGRHRLVFRTSCGTARKTVRVESGRNVSVSYALCPSSPVRSTDRRCLRDPWQCRRDGDMRERPVPR